MSIEDQFDVAAQDRQAEAAKAARLSTLGQAILATPELVAAAAALEAEVPEVPGKMDQEPEVSMVCEAHPNLEWPHDDCPGPGMPPTAVGTALTREHVQIGDVIEWEGLNLRVTGFDSYGVAMTEPGHLSVSSG